jgi:hypothetical protein
MSNDDRSHAVDVLTKALEQLSAAGRPVTTIQSEEPIAPAEDG